MKWAESHLLAVSHQSSKKICFCPVQSADVGIYTGQTSLLVCVCVCVDVQVKVMLRVCAVSHAESSSFLKVDSRKKQVSIMDPASNSTSQQNSNQKRGASTQAPPKMFTFDSAFSHDASQVIALNVFLLHFLFQLHSIR